MKKVLIIDDDEDITMVLNLVFSAQGFQTYTFLRAASIPEIEEIGPDLIILDEWLAEVTGSSLCHSLKEDPKLKNIPVYLVSAVQSLADIAKSCQADGYIEKPFDLKDIEAIAKSV